MSRDDLKRSLGASAISVLIAHDNPGLAAELRRVVGSRGDMAVIGEVASGDQVLARTLELSPAVVLLDLAMPGCGLRLLHRLSELAPQVRVVVLAMDEGNIALLRSALAHGDLGYVVAATAHDELVSVIRKVTAGRSYVDVPTGEFVIDPRAAMPPELRQRLDSLSKREREVLEGVAYGYTNREIADWLGIGIKSIETYRYRLAEKLEFKSRADLVRFALETGLLGSGSDPVSGVFVRPGS